ncbi:DUF1737 domain-containing protein [Psychromonas ossibalaenae]|uniref:DUF1737 domain-containing protein n=1 Tax=Psychromonas ossibalaenae TaxID=444922 RepID=UPI0003743AF2|nr:DUF1737 domain-containing protein [Psychromonas ossibalaenae]
MPQTKETYKLITGKDDGDFCARVTKLLEEGYELYGSPAMSFNGEHIVVAQALIKAGPQLL